MPDRNPVLVARSRVAHDVKHGRDATQSRAQLAEAKLAAYIREVVDSAPQMSAEQRDRLALLLRGGDAA